MATSTKVFLAAAVLPLLMTVSAGAAQGPGAGAGAAAADEIVTVAGEPESWGTSTDILQVYGVGDFVAPADTVTWNTAVSGTTGISLFQAGGGQVDWWLQFHIPGGSTLVRVDVEACDTSATGALNFGLARGATPGGAAANISAVASTGVAATPGCAFFPVTPTATTVINNATNDYWLFYDWTAASSAVQIHSVRVVYRLAVNPAPATATFSDVPVGHPQHRFVEALAATGITGGCGAGVFCPDAPLTRGQMAVFLAVAFGLHSNP
jgi:S-layer family protein